MTITAEIPKTDALGAIRINDCAIKLANVNGTGSASANSLLMQAIFRMGIPVSGKNLFPSNIQGLPTWYEIRVNKTGFTARALDYDLMVAMNSQTYGRDIEEVTKGGYVLYDSSWPLDPELVRDDVTFLGVPLAMMCNEHFNANRERILMKNIAYAGAILAILGIEVEMVEELLDQKFAGKEKLMASNHKAIHLGYDFAQRQFEPVPFKLEPMESKGDRILVDGNTAAALGAVYAGATVAAWYPITPSTSVMDAFGAFCRRFRRDPDTGKNNYMIIQAEDELAAIGMVIGANWNGARAFTSTSGPGISLMNELLGLAYYAEIPAVVVDVQRTGPSTGMPTRTQQGDILECAYASHGDTKHLLLFPGNPNECFDFAVKSFDLAEHFQTPVFLMSDLDIGMNDWVVPRLNWDDAYKPDRGRVLDAAQLEKLKTFYRYTGEDGEFVAPRTLPGISEKGAFFTRGSGHNKFGGYTEYPDEYQEVVDRLKLKHQAAAARMPEPVVVPAAAFKRHGDSVSSEAIGVSGTSSTSIDAAAPIGIVTVGGCDLAVREALAILSDIGIQADFMRVRGFPFGKNVLNFLNSHNVLFVVEQNRDAQLKSLFLLETEVAKDKLHSILAYGGFPLSAKSVVEGVRDQFKNPSLQGMIEGRVPLSGDEEHRPKDRSSMSQNT